jgi:putative CocE/NonD family hydrolase
VFTSAPLTAARDVVGPGSARLRVLASSGHFDLFTRLCDVDPRGRSRNVCDGIIRHRPGASGGGQQPEANTAEQPEILTVPMSATAHRFAAGHRLRLQVSGGAHPRFARNTGSGEPPAPRLDLSRWTCKSCTMSPAPAPCCFPCCPDVAIRAPEMGH